MPYTATHKYARISARKVRALADLVEGRVEVAPGGVAERFHYAALAQELEGELEAAIYHHAP